MKAASDNSRAAFRATVTSVRSRLLKDIYDETDRRYSLRAKDRTGITLRPAEEADWEILSPLLAGGADIDALVRERAYTLANRLAFLFLLEARGLRPVNLVLNGTVNSPFKEHFEFFGDLAAGADCGYAFLLDQVWDSLSRDLSALFTRTAVQECLPVPGTTLLYLINEFAKPELADVWLDDTSAGWLYQYWNDPDRKAVDEKLKDTTGKVEAAELAHKTQLFTERYMVEWLVQNSLGAQWLCLCAKKGWQYEADRTNDFWKFYVQQELSAEAVASSPLRVADFRILDPAMGSGHFLVYVFDFLFMLYTEEARLSKTEISVEAILDSIFADNIHGIDIDSRAVQIAAAALFVKAREHVRTYRFKSLNLVATDLGLSQLTDDDASLLSFIEIMQKEAGLVSSLSRRIVNMLKTADYMGSLLQVNEEIKKIATLYSTDEDITDTIIRALTRFVKKHDTGLDLGIQSLAEQLDKGIRLIKLLDTKFDVIVANPPYLGLAKTDDTMNTAFSKAYPASCTDLYGVFIERSFQLSKAYGFIAMVTMQNFMFLSSFEELRKVIYKKSHIASVAHLGAYAFQELRDHALAVMFVFYYGTPSDKKPGIYQRYLKPKKKEDLLISQSRTYSFPQERFADIPGSPMIYWWPEEFRTAYLKAIKLGDVSEVKQGSATTQNSRFIRKYWEVNCTDIDLIQIKHATKNTMTKTWQPYVMGAKDKRWFETIDTIIKWKYQKKEIWEKVKDIKGGMIKNEYLYFHQGIAFSYTGTIGFLCRLRKFKSIFDVQGSSIFCANPDKIQTILSSNVTGFVSQSLNPTIANQACDIANLPVLDFISDYQTYLDRARVLYDDLFASTESNLEYRYGEMEEERFEVEEARIRDEIDKEILSHFSADTVASIYEEIGETPFDYPVRKSGFIPDDFAEAYQQSAGILELAHRYRLHPDSIIELKNETGLVHQSQRQAKAFKHLSWALGVLMGRFDSTTGGLLDLGPGIVVESPDEKGRDSGLSQRTWSGKPDANSTATAGEFAGPQEAHPHGLVYLSSLDQDEGFTRELGWNAGTECVARVRGILRKRHGTEKETEIWQDIEDALVRADGRENIGEWIRCDAFARHKELYENRPIYFPLVSAKKNFFVWVNIHRWNDGTLNAILANYLKKDGDMLEARVRRLREDIVQTDDKRVRNELEDAVYRYDRLHEELSDFSAVVTRIAQRGPAPDEQEAEAPFAMDLDDGVMVNSAALWELVAPLWKDPKKWWAILSKPSGKKDYDWSHLAMRYWPDRVLAKVRKDPSLAVAHSDYGAYTGRDLFAELHPAAAKKWAEQAGKKGGEENGGKKGEREFLRRDAGELAF